MPESKKPGHVRLIQVRTRSFVAGFEVDETTDTVTRAAPILRNHIMGKTSAEARAILNAKGWHPFVVWPRGMNRSVPQGKIDREVGYLSEQLKAANDH
jgi:hypothetical protein